MSFTQDLKEGREIEEQFVALLRELGIKAGLNTSTTQREMALYDVYDESYNTYEVKFDRKALETGNIFLEQASINRSHATYIVYKLRADDNFYILDTPTVKNLIDNPDFKVKDGGYPPYPGTLIPLVDFRKIFKVVDKNLTPKTPETPKPDKAKRKAVEAGVNIRQKQRR